MTQTKNRRSTLFVAATAAVLASLGTGAVVLEARALLFDRGAAKTTQPAEARSDEEPSPQPPVARAPESDRRATHEPPRPNMPSGPDLRASVRDVSAARAAGVRDVAGLTGLLAELENTARTKGHVTAFEVEPGMAAIRALYASDDAEQQRVANEFGGRMAKLSASFDPSPPPPASAQGPLSQR